MPAETWTAIASQIPVVVVFAAIMIKITAMFLAHLSAVEERSKAFIKEQREANNAALDRITDRVCGDLDTVMSRLNDLSTLDIGHDAFVRTAFRERFGPVIMAQAEQASAVAEARAEARVQGGNP